MQSVYIVYLITLRCIQIYFLNSRTLQIVYSLVSPNFPYTAAQDAQDELDPLVKNLSDYDQTDVSTTSSLKSKEISSFCIAGLWGNFKQKRLAQRNNHRSRVTR